LDNIDVSLGKSHGRQTSGIAFLKKVLADKKGSYQLLCANCNWIKRWENEEHTGTKSIKAKAAEKILFAQKE